MVATSGDVAKSDELATELMIIKSAFRREH